MEYAQTTHLLSFCHSARNVSMGGRRTSGIHLQWNLDLLSVLLCIIPVPSGTFAYCLTPNSALWEIQSVPDSERLHCSNVWVDPPHVTRCLHLNQECLGPLDWDH